MYKQMNKQMNRRLSVVLAAAVSLIGSLSWAEPTTTQLITDLEKKAETVKSYSADLTMEMEMMGKKMITRGKAVFKRPNSVRIEMVMDMGQMKMEHVVISDGKTMWTHQPLMKIVAKIDLEKCKAVTKSDALDKQNQSITRPFEAFDKKNISYVGAKKLGETPVHVFEGQIAGPKWQGMPFAPAKIRTSIGADDGLLRRVSMLNEEGVAMMTQTYTKIKVNVKPSDDLFKFEPPEGTQVMDMTEGTINMLKQMEAKKKEAGKEKDAE